ncbi:MAG: hypothetical protein JWM31_1321 [Solirubrobacterales bacterium]|nr:hypothetical protein [Solirubrobacterales bacterium]
MPGASSSKQHATRFGEARAGIAADGSPHRTDSVRVSVGVMRIRTASAVLAVALAVAVASPPAHAAPSSTCRAIAASGPKGRTARVVARSSSALVFSKGVRPKNQDFDDTNFYACRFARPKAVLIRRADGFDQEITGRIKLAGDYAAFELHSVVPAGCACSGAIEVRSMRSGKRVAYGDAYLGTVPETAEAFYSEVTSFVLTATGTVAWIGKGTEYQTAAGPSSLPPDYTVAISNGTAMPTPADQGPDIAPRYLKRLSGGINWLRGGEVKTAAF